MAVLDIALGQVVSIPALQLTNGEVFEGQVRASDGEKLVIEISKDNDGRVPDSADETCVLVWECNGMRRTVPILVRSKSTHAIVGQIIIQEQRRSPRVRVEMQLTYELVLPAQIRDIAEEVMARVNSLDNEASETTQLLQNIEDPIGEIRGELNILREMVSELIVKVDDLTHMMSGDAPRSSHRYKHPLGIQNCSGTGLGFIASEPHLEGEYLRMNMSMRTVPPTVIDCMAVVVRCSPLDPPAGQEQSKRYDIGVQFSHIHEVDREKLIRYLFKVQRRTLRDRREARESMAKIV